jgi:uncharacterized protein
MRDEALSDGQIQLLQQCLDAIPAPLEPLDASMLDGYLCGVLLQPRPVPPSRWLRRVHDIEGRDAPPNVALDRLHALVRRRHAELERAIAARRWFDPWVFELEGEASPSETVLPWVAGFATALELFPALIDEQGDALVEPLALLYRHLDPEDLEDADAIRKEIETLEPTADLADAVDDLVRGTLLIADVSRPRGREARAKRGGHGK